MVLYARACRAAPPDARRLAAWLVAARLDGPGWPDFELAEFAGALGDAGLAEVAQLTEERRAAADPDSWTALGIKILREQLAAASGDVDAHVAVLTEDLRSARGYSEMVAVLRDAGRDGDAEQWARKGLARERSDPWADELRDQLVELLLSGGWGDEAVAICSPGQVPEAQWHDLIGLREKDHPADVIARFRI